MKLLRKWLSTKADLRIVFFLSEHVNGSEILKDYVDGFGQLKNLTLRRNYIRTLNESYFQSLTELSNLDLSQNHIIKLHQNVFQNLMELETLNLSDNGIKILNESHFQSLPKLSNLDLSRNSIMVQHQSVFQNLTELTTLNLSKNILTSLAEGMFNDQKKLHTLFLQGNKIDTLTTEMFNGSIFLNDLFLEKNNFADLKDNVFNYLPNLRQISLGSGNRKVTHGKYEEVVSGSFSMPIPYTILASQRYLDIVSLESVKVENGLQLSGLKTFEIKWSEVLNISGLSNIEKVSIINNRLRPYGLAANTFINLGSTKKLDLSSNKISHLEDELFDGLTELTSLQLSKNHLQNISGRIFRDLRSLTEIDLSDNNLTTIHPDAFEHTTLLTTMNLKNNRLSFSDYKTSFIMHLYNLATLNLCKINLTRMPSELVEVKRLDLSHNQISSVTFREIRQNLIDLNSTYETRPTFGSKFIHVYLNDNPLLCDCGMFDFLSGKDHQKQLAPVFSHSCEKNPALNFCHPKNFTTDQCPTGCICTKRVDDHGHHMLITCKGEELSGPLKIEFVTNSSIELDISHNTLKELPVMNQNLRVTFIQASFNHISKIGIENLPSTLRVLDLSHNQIRTIAAEVIHHIMNHKSLETFFLKNNTLECHCSSNDTEQFIKFVNINSSMTDLQGAKCNELDDLTMDELRKNCEIAARNAPIVSSLISVTILILISVVFLLLFIRHHQIIKMWLYAHDWFLWWVDEEYVDRDKVYDVFMSYAHEDKMLAYRIVHALEKCNIFKVCLHERDFIGGGRIEESVTRAVHNSRRTLVILSEKYLQSVWCKHEFHLAWDRSAAENRKLIIAVKEGNLGNITDDIIQSYIKTCTYIESGDEWFWERLIFKLPLPHNKKIKNIFPIRELNGLDLNECN